MSFEEWLFVGPPRAQATAMHLIRVLIPAAVVMRKTGR
jgi:hypothetical protein